MAFKEVQSLDADNAISLGGYNKKTKKENPTTAQGYYLGTRMVPSKLAPSGEAALHILQTDKGNLGVWGKTDLDRKIKQVTAGAMIRITQTGTRPTNKGNDAYVYKVEIDEGNSIPVAPALDTASQNEDEDGSYAAGEFDGAEELEDDVPMDEPPPARPARPAQAASAPDAARQRKVQELLSKARTKTA